MNDGRLNLRRWSREWFESVNVKIAWREIECARPRCSLQIAKYIDCLMVISWIDPKRWSLISSISVQQWLDRSFSITVRTLLRKFVRSKPYSSVSRKYTRVKKRDANSSECEWTIISHGILLPLMASEFISKSSTWSKQRKVVKNNISLNVILYQTWSVNLSYTAITILLSSEENAIEKKVHRFIEARLRKSFSQKLGDRSL